MFQQTLESTTFRVSGFKLVIYEISDRNHTTVEAPSLKEMAIDKLEHGNIIDKDIEISANTYMQMEYTKYKLPSLTVLNCIVCQRRVLDDGRMMMCRMLVTWRKSCA